MASKEPFKDLLKRYLNRNGFLPTELARESGVSQAYLSMLLNDQRRNPSQRTIEKLARALNAPQVEFLQAAGIAARTPERIMEETPAPAASQPSALTPSASGIRIFKTATDAYRHLTEYVERFGAKEAELIQISCETSQNLVFTLLEKGAAVSAYIIHPDVGIRIGSQLQSGRATDRPAYLMNWISGLEVPGRLTIRQYNVPPSFSAVCIDRKILMVGWYTYEYPAKERDTLMDTWRDDEVVLWGHTVPALIVERNDPGYEFLQARFDRITNNYIKNTDEIHGRFILHTGKAKATRCGVLSGDLPASVDPLYGREVERRVLDEAWDNSSKRIVCLTGPEGSGKTSLMGSFLRQKQRDGYAGATRVFVWSFENQGGEEGVASAETFINEALKFFGEPSPKEGSPWEKGARLALEHVLKQPALVVIDGLERLQSAPGSDGKGRLLDASLAGFLCHLAASSLRSPSLCIVSSRWEISQLAPFENEEGGTTLTVRLARLSREAGFKLLGDLKGPESNGIRVEETERIDELVNRLDGNPLALTLLGRLLSQHYDGEVVRCPPEVVGGQDDRNRSPVNRVIAAIDDMLMPGEKCLLRLLGVLDRPAHAAEVAALRSQGPEIKGLNDQLRGLGPKHWNNLLERLSGAGLLLEFTRWDLPPKSSGDEKLDIHPTVRDFFRRQLAELDGPKANGCSEAWKQTHERLAEYESQEAAKLNAPNKLLRACKAAIHHCQATKYSEAIRMYWGEIQAGSQRALTYTWGRPSDALAVLGAFFQRRWTHPVAGIRPRIRAHVLLETALELWHTGRLDDAVNVYNLALDDDIIKMKKQDGTLKYAHDNAMVRRRLAEVLLQRGKFREALRHAREGVKVMSRVKFEAVGSSKRLLRLSSAFDGFVGIPEQERSDGINRDEHMDTYVTLAQRLPLYGGNRQGSDALPKGRGNPKEKGF